MQSLYSRTKSYLTDRKPEQRPFTTMYNRPKLGFLNKTRNFFNPARVAAREAAYEQRIAEMEAQLQEVRTRHNDGPGFGLAATPGKSRKSRKSRKTRKQQRR